MRESQFSFTPEPEHTQTECGLAALYSEELSTEAMIAVGMLAADGVQHRGLQGAGLAYGSNDEIVHDRGNGLLRDYFTAEKLKTFTKQNTGHWIEFQTRYGSDPEAAYSIANLQPIISRTQDGSRLDGTPFSVIHNGQFVAKDRIRRQVYETTGREYPDDVSDSFLAAQLIANAPGESIDAKVIEGINSLQGAFSMVIGVQDRLYATRDRQGLQPLSIGKVQDGWMVASEDHALRKAGVKTDRSILKGEIVRIDTRGMMPIQAGEMGADNFCDFDWSYFGRPDSTRPTFESPDDALHPDRWLSFHMSRRALGILMAQELMSSPQGRAYFEGLDGIYGAPDSGTSFGTGLARGSKIPYEAAIIRDHFDKNGKLRLFQEADLAAIQNMVAGKLSFAPGSVEGKRIGIADDSQVRSNVSRELVKQAWAAGAIEVVMFYAFPMVMGPCHLGKNMRTREELIAWRHQGDLKGIAEEINATRVMYPSWSTFIESRKQGGEIIIPEDEREIFLANGGCGGCLTGVYPIDKEGNIHQLGPMKATRPVSLYR